MGRVSAAPAACSGVLSGQSCAGVSGQEDRSCGRKAEQPSSRSGVTAQETEMRFPGAPDRPQPSPVGGYLVHLDAGAVTHPLCI